MLKNRFPYLLMRRQQVMALQQQFSKAEQEISLATDFVKEIEKGNLETAYFNGEHQEHQESSALAQSLFSMAAKMQQISKEEKERNWSTEGFAKFIDILRSKNDDTKELADNIFSNLIKYMNVNQGALYLINDDDPKDIFIELITCYAYNRKKHLERRIALGEGLIGQVVFEKETTYMTEIPDKYIKITSGLGDALPRNLLIVPLKIDEKVLGAIELASFTKIADYQIQFVERLGESIASTISSVKINQQTKLLLQESQQQTEEMKAQEEEMRQNMEELSATQEDMDRAMKEVQEKETYLSNLINASKDAIYALDKDHKIILSNEVFNRGLTASGVKVEKGLDMKRFSNDPKEIENYNKALSGQTIEDTLEYEGRTYFATYSPIKGALGEITGLVVFTKDVTEQQELLHISQQQTLELKAQEEAMRQQMEELSATQEEMEKVLREVQDKEQYLNALIDISKDAIFTMTKDYKVISYNKAYEDSISVTGIKVTPGMDALLFFKEEEKEHYKSLYDQVFQGKSFELTHNFSVDGNESHMNVYYAPVKDAKGDIIATAVFASNITEKALLQREVQAREDVLGLTTILSESDLHGTITYVNEKFCEVSGYTEQELLKQPHSILRHPDMPKALFKALWTTIKAGNVFKAIVKNKTKSGGHYWVDATIMPVKDNTGKTVKYIGARYHLTNDAIAEQLYYEQAKQLGFPLL